MTSRLTAAARSLVLGIVVTAFAQGALAQDSSDSAASGVKAKKPMRARVTGGPGYVSEAAPASGSSGSTAPTKKKARVTGGPGGTAGTPDASTPK